MKLLLLAGAGLLALIFRGGGRKTAWTGAGLPRPAATLPELKTLATELGAALRARAPTSTGLVRQFQRAAGLLAAGGSTVRTAEEERDRLNMTTPGESRATAAAAGTYDTITRQALGYYGQLWQEETP